MVHALPTEQPDGTGEGAAPQGSSQPAALLRIARPKQWVKNVLVLAAPAAAGVLGHAGPLLRSLGALGIFCLAASATYFVNDTLDAEADRHHPVKRYRPVAAGVVRPRQAIAAAVVLMGLATGLAWWLAGYRLAVVIVVYLAISTAYSIRLKHELVLDLVGLSSGFILRAVAGGVAAHVPLSDWFLIVVSFGSLLIAVGKRSSEHLHLGESRGLHRPVLAEYPASFLRFVRLLACSVTITAYCLWAFQRSASIGSGHHPLWFELSVVPVVLVILHLELRFDQGRGGAPEEMALHDRTLQVLGTLWVLLFALGVYA
jgi:decaprenyl-phosphate phosphoribosyltransferase